jgi:hypothetical protein
MQALIFNNKLVDVSEEAFEVHSSMEWIDAPDGCTPEWVYSDGKVSPYVDPEDTRTYADFRLKAYNALNQLELISDDSINGTTTHKDAILAIKAEFPKPV